MLPRMKTLDGTGVLLDRPPQPAEISARMLDRATAARMVSGEGDEWMRTEMEEEYELVIPAGSSTTTEPKLGESSVRVRVYVEQMHLPDVYRWRTRIEEVSELLRRLVSGIRIDEVEADNIYHPKPLRYTLQVDIPYLCSPIWFFQSSGRGTSDGLRQYVHGILSLSTSPGPERSESD